MEYSQDAERLPRGLGPSILAGVGLVVAIVAGGAWLIARGVTDPPVAGPVRWADDTLAWAGGPVLPLPAGGGVWFAAPEPLPFPSGDFTLTVEADWPPETDPLAAWGVWLEEPDGSRVVHAINAAGYTTTRRCPAEAIPPAAIEDCPALRPEWRWSPYPRIHPPGQPNTITLHREPDGSIRLRLNRERLGAGNVAVSGRWGVWARGGERASTLVWRVARIHTPPD